MKRKIRNAALALLRGLGEFFNPRDWVPQLPIMRKRHPDARGYQTFGEAIRGFPKEED